MEYRIKRTSMWGDDSPCEGAISRSVVTVDRRNVDDPKKIPANNGTDGDWYTKGTNHRIENGNICRDTGFNNEWFIEIPDLMEFVKGYGDCIIKIGDGGIPEIEIYDDYRE